MSKTDTILRRAFALLSTMDQGDSICISRPGFADGRIRLVYRRESKQIGYRDIPFGSGPVLLAFKLFRLLSGADPGSEEEREINEQ